METILLGVLGLLTGIGLSLVFIGIFTLNTTKIIWGVISTLVMLFFIYMTLVNLEAQYYNVSCEIDNEVIYVETTQSLPDINEYDSCLIEVVK